MIIITLLYSVKSRDIQNSTYNIKVLLSTYIHGINTENGTWKCWERNIKLQGKKGMGNLFMRQKWFTST